MSISPKEVEEKINISFVFHQFTTVSNPIITVYDVKDDTHTDIPAMKGSAPVVLGNRVSMLLVDGVAGTRYELKCQVDGDTGERLIARDTILVKA